MRYEIPVNYFGPSAKNRAVIGTGAMEWIILEAKDDDEAWTKVVARLDAQNRRDRRPIQGRSYIRKWRADHVTLNAGLAPLAALPRYKLNDPIILHRPFGCAMSDDGKGYRTGYVSEVVTDTFYSIALNGYHNQFVDFTIREFAPVK